MRGMFNGYDNTPSIDYSVVWRNALIVFDTNVLLNLYRYRVGTREELTSVLTKLGNKIWIPHHVALEFQRNRLAVIAEQNKRFTEVRAAVEEARKVLGSELEKLQLTKRHSLISSDLLIAGFNRLATEFFAEIQILENQQQKVGDCDLIKETIESLFLNRVGGAPLKQQEVDDVYKNAEIRYKAKIPPGYEDDLKDRDGADEYMHDRILYKRKFGDYLVWTQILKHSSAKKYEYLIFVTDDQKEDWWRKLKQNGWKTIGPRPELVEEANQIGIKTFLMYTPEAFLSYAKKFLQADISDATLEEVRDVSEVSIDFEDLNQHNPLAQTALSIVKQWLSVYNDSVILERSGSPSFTCERNSQIYAYQLEVLREGTFDRQSFGKRTENALNILNDEKYSGRTLIWLAQNSSDIWSIFNSLSSGDKFFRNKIQVIIGTILSSENNEQRFVPYHTIG